MTNYVVVSLEKIGEEVEKIPKISTTVHTTHLGPSKSAVNEPSNLASGLAVGTKSMLKNVFSAVAGVVVEPVKGAKKGGIKGSALGVGKGLLGLICKPVKGSIDLVTQTTRGISNTPRTMYVGMTKMIKTVPKGKLVNPIDDCFIGEKEGETLYISKRRLKE